VGLFWLNTAETWIDISSNTADRVSQSIAQLTLLLLLHYC